MRVCSLQDSWRSILNRRSFVRTSSLTSGAVALGLNYLELLAAARHSAQESVANGKLLEELEFLNEGRVAMDSAFGDELDGRLYTLLSGLSNESLVTPADRFYIRTRASQILPNPESWSITLDGLVAGPQKLKIGSIQAAAKPLGLHLLECAGNTRAAHFGMISVAEWAGVPISEILSEAKAKSSATQVLISGFDRYATDSVTSTPGASWVFPLEELLKSGAFLATQLNSLPLSRDHGAPVRLVVPNWYGCACIKWVDRVSFLNNSAASTSQMLEYATRTHQVGSPKLAKDFLPARIEHAAMPIRVEKWLVNEKVKYRVVGILWGGTGSIRSLGIRFNPEEDFVLVDSLPSPQTAPWTIWSHSWNPKAPGRYTIRLALLNPELHPKRLDSGYYARSVEIIDV